MIGNGVEELGKRTEKLVTVERRVAPDLVGEGEVAPGRPGKARVEGFTGLPGVRELVLVEVEGDRHVRVGLPGVGEEITEIDHVGDDEQRRGTTRLGLGDQAGREGHGGPTHPPSPGATGQGVETDVVHGVPGPTLGPGSV